MLVIGTWDKGKMQGVRVVCGALAAGGALHAALGRPHAHCAPDSAPPTPQGHYNL